jgi:hypothetical protein
MDGQNFRSLFNFISQEVAAVAIREPLSVGVTTVGITEIQLMRAKSLLDFGVPFDLLE